MDIRSIDVEIFFERLMIVLVFLLVILGVITLTMAITGNLTIKQKHEYKEVKMEQVTEEQIVEEQGFHFEWGKFLDSLESVESSNGTDTDGAAGEVGILQITQACLDDVNEAWKTRFTLEDCANTKHGREISRTVCFKYITMYGFDTDYESACGCWNGGPRWKTKKGITKTRIRSHYVKMMREMNIEI